MKDRVVTLATALVLGLVVNAAADEGDDTLRMYLSKSDIVVAGELLSEPKGRASEAGVVHLSFRFRVTDVLKGKAVDDRDILVAIARYELMSGDDLPWVRKGAKATLFLRKRSTKKGTGPELSGADMWFGIQPANWTMQKSLKRLAGEAAAKNQSAKR